MLLRPTPTNLYLIDLNSTNGTFHNSVPVGPGIARALEDGDTLLLGRLGLAVRVIARPTVQDAKPSVIRYEPPEELDTDKYHLDD